MRRHKVIITIEAETVLTIAELKKLERMFFRYEPQRGVYLDRDPEAEKNCGPCLGTITQVQVNAIKPAKASAKSKPPRR